MNRPTAPEFAPALVIAGMHRSGTSLVAGLCQAAGLRVGDRLLGAYRGNEAGHFEDLDFVEWHQLVLRANGLAPEGFVAEATPQVPAALEWKAEALVTARREPGGIWGWKDPRTTLHLEFWRRVVPEARFLFIVRRPWEVVDSLFRRGDEAFRSNPPFAIQVWTHYNRLVRDFAVKHPEQSLVCDLSQVVKDPAAVFEAVRHTLGVPLGEPPEHFRPELLSRTTEASRIAFVAATCPEALALYEELAALAGSEPPRLDIAPGDRGAVAGHGFQEWSHCRTLGGRMQLLDQSLTEADEAAAQLGAELAEAREARDAAIRQGREQTGSLQSQLDLARRQFDDSQDRLQEVSGSLAAEAQARAALENRFADAERRFVNAAAEHDAALASSAARIAELEAAGTATAAQTAQLEARLHDATRQIEELARAADHGREEVAAAAAERASLDSARATAESRTQGLEAQVQELEAWAGELESRLAAAESRAVETELARDDLERQLHTLEGSNSWKLTRPLRSFRRRAMSRPTDWLRRKVSKTGRKWWRSLPISIGTKQRLRHRLFTSFAPLFRWTDSYRDWAACRSPAAAPPPQAAPAPAPAVQPAAFRAPHAAPEPAATLPVQEAGVRLIAMHLPQFHRIPENDAWWGEGFTEWTNVRRGRPMYAGHEQPHVPHPDVGYYDLADPAALERQAAMAAAHGIHGFCFYYYWFGGRRLLEKPLAEMLRSGRPNFPFCICWANENWTRTWDGHDTEILMAQSHEPSADRDFIRDVIPLLRDPRYIRVAGRPLLAVYRPESLADPRRAAATWREECRRAGIGEIHLVAVRSFSKDDPARFGFDAAIQFPPLQIPARNLARDAAAAAVPGFSGSIHDYAEAAAFSLAETAPGFRMYRGVMPAWDNTARRMERATSWTGSSPARYGAWLRATIDRTIREQPSEHRLVFVNAWNEWAEGAHLEPDTRHGYACLDETAAALGLPSPVRPVAPPAAPPATAQATATAFAATDSLPNDPPELRQHAWSLVTAFVGGEPSRERHGFLADHTALLGQLAASGCRLRIDDGRVVAEAGGVETALDHRRDLADALAVARGDDPEAPFCFVVLQFGRFDVTARCLESLRRLESRRPVRIVVVDNGSPADVVEATRAVVAALPDVELVETGANLGFAGGNNVGYAHARDRLGAAFIAVINNDTRIEQADFILRCERLFRETACSVLGPDIITPDGRRENPWNDTVYGPGEWRRLEAMYHEDRADFERTGQPRFRRLGRRSPEAAFVPNPVLQGAAIVLSPVFVRGMPTLFDERTKLYGEEFLFAVDTLLAGHFMAYAPEIRILHEEGVSTGSLPSATKMRLGYENAALAAGLAAGELDNFAAACRGEPLDCRSESLVTLVAGPRRHVLVDLFFCQPGYHGGGEYGKAVFRGLAGAAAARSDVTIWAALDPALHIDLWVLAECRRLGIRVIAVRSYAEIVALVNAGRFDAFFCPAIIVYTGYEYMRRAGTRLPFTGGRTRVVGTLHDIRDLQLIRDREAITAALVQAGWRPQAAGPGSFLSASAPAPTALAAMYAAICHDPHVDALVTVSRYCRGVLEAEFAPPPGRFAVLCSAEKDRPEPIAYRGYGIGDDGRPFALVLHAARPEKNAPSVAAAFDRLFAAAGDPFGLADLRVVFVGISSLDDLGLDGLARPERFTAVPEVPPGQLEYLFERARMLVYASFNEGFGYPPVEAMRYGTPAVVAAVAAIPEVCGDAAVSCDPRDVDSIAGAILQAWHDPPARERIVSRHAAIVTRQRRDLLDLVRLVIDGVRPAEHAPEAAPARVVAAAPPGYVLRHAGWCPICEQATTFSATERWLRDHYLCERCHSLPRERALMVALQTRFPDWRRLRIHESPPELRGLSAKLARECPGYVASQYDPATPFGTLEPGGRWRSEDLERQSFDSGSFDVVITQDVFEHIFDTDAAFREVQRTLRPGGAHLLTTPLVRGEAASRRRAERAADGVRHLEPPEFHGNPMSADGSLVTWDWGYDIVEQIRACTGDEARRIMVPIPALGMVAAYLDVIVVERGNSAVDRGARSLPRHVAAH
jgi:GT2 family glycosyltransferase/glycosyltransferase involved in cell wall biosynthesis